MQIMLFALLLLAGLAFLLYKTTNKFGGKEILILLVLVTLASLTTYVLLENSKNKVPKLFKKKYEEEKKVHILKLSFERLNNKNLSSNTNFIYDFNYIIQKNQQTFVCQAHNVHVKKIEDVYIFEGFNQLKERCEKQ